MRVAFTFIGGKEWTGGQNYLLNLLRVLRSNPDCGVEPVLFVGRNAPDEQLAPFLPLLPDPPVRHEAFEHRVSSRRLARAITLGTSPDVDRTFYAERIDVAFEAAQFYGWRFPFPALAWTPDFQHRHLPHMFSRRAWWRRELGYRAQVAAGRTLMLSSEDARADSEQFYPESRGRTVVVRFAVLPPDLGEEPGPALLAKHGLPARYLYLPNQFWKHKNHAVVIHALKVLKDRGEDVLVAASGNPSDTRHADHYRGLVQLVRDLGVEDRFRLLGMIPYRDVLGLTYLSRAVVNPSFFEGWSTTVEEAKSLGAPLVLSDLGVHREQAGPAATYFDPDSPPSAADAMLQAWRREDLAPAAERRAHAAALAGDRARQFASAFADAAFVARDQYRARRRRQLRPLALIELPGRARPRRHAIVADEPLKLLLVHNFYRSAAPGGEDFAFRQERDLLAAAGVEVVTYTRSNDDVDEQNRRAVLKVAAGMNWSHRTHRELRALIEREKPDVAHFHNTFPQITSSGYAACQELGVPVVQTLHNYRLVCVAGTFFREGRVCELCTSESAWPGVRHRCYRNSLAGSLAVAWMLRSNWSRGNYTDLVDVYVALTRFAADRFVSEGLPRERVIVNPNFVDSTAPPHHGGGGYVVFAARMSEEKGIATLLDAWRELRDVPLKVVGDGPLLPEMARRAREEALPVEFLGMRPRAEVLDIMGRADLQVVPSVWYEGFPLVIVESYARGTPVIASHIGGLKEIVVPGETGLYFEPGDAAGLARQVRRLWHDPALRERMRAGARRRYEEEFTPAQARERLLGIYRRARQTGARRRALGLAAG